MGRIARIRLAAAVSLLAVVLSGCVAPRRHPHSTDMGLRPHSTRRASNAQVVTVTDDSGRWYAGPVGLHVGVPAGPSLGLGVLRSLSCKPAVTCEDRETIGMLIAEPGLNAGRASVGITRVAGGLGNALTARATYLQRWRNTTGRYGGLELSWQPIVYVGARVGAFRPLGQSNRPILWTLDASFGL